MRAICLCTGLALVAVGLVAGCKSSQPGSSSHAAVEIQGHSVKEIQATTLVVFAENGFTLRTNTPTLMRFDRPASTSEKLKYGDWLNDGMRMQVKVRVLSLPESAHMLTADVFRVLDPDDPNFREERRVTLLGSSYYQKLLEDVRHRLNPSAEK